MNDIRRLIYEKEYFRRRSQELSAEPGSKHAFAKQCDFSIAPLLHGFPKNGRILELGCGSGDFLDYLRDRGYDNIRGVDIASSSVAAAALRGLRVEQADIISYLGSIREEFDAVIAFDVIEHFTRDELLTLCGLVFERLAPDGIFLMRTPNGEGLFPRQIIYGDLTHSTILTQSSARQLLSVIGFTDFRFSETGPIPTNLKGRLRKTAWGIIKAAANLLRMIECGKRQVLWTENMICLCRKPSSSRSDMIVP